MATCPNCGSVVKGSALIGASFWRPYVCPNCAKASRVMRPFGQASILSFFAVLVGMVTVRYFAFPVNMVLAVVGLFVVWGLDALLLGSTARLTPVLPRNPANEA